MAIELITSKCELSIEPNELAAMNLTAGRRALASTAYKAALSYLNTGIQLLADDSWEQEYQLTLSLYEAAAEAAYLAGKIEQTEELIEVVLANAKTLLEQVKVYEVKIQALGAQNKALEAVNLALSFVKQLGVEFPANPNQSDIEQAMAEVKTNLAGKSIKDLVNLPGMEDAKSLAVMNILSNIITFSYQATPEVFPLILFKQVNLSLQYGNTTSSAFAYVTYGLILCGVMGDIESGYQFGKLAESLLNNSNKEIKAKIIQTFNAHVKHWKEDSHKILKHFIESYRAGMESGDLEFASLSINAYSYFSYFMGIQLQDLEMEIKNYNNYVKLIKQETIYNWNQIYQQCISNLLGMTKKTYELSGDLYDENKMLPIHIEANDRVALSYLFLNKLHLCYLFQQLPQAIENTKLAEKYLDAATGKFIVPVFYLYDSLTWLAVYSDVSISEQQQILKKVRANQEKMRHWADNAPMNYLHKFYLVEAEKYRVLDNKLEAIELYDRAIALAQENEYINEEALAYELAAKFYLGWGKHKIAQTYLIDAYYGYSRWGAKAKVDDLAKRYPRLLAPILHSENSSLLVRETITSNHISTRNQTVFSSSNTTISDFLDLATAIKASQAISGEIEIEQLLAKLMKVVMENAGASKSALVLSTGKELTLTSLCYSSNSGFTRSELPDILLESSDDVPISLINYVKRTQEIFVCDNSSTENSLVTDRYIIRQQPKSLLCMPILNQGKLLGILYLENNLTVGAFTRDRLELLKMITTQAAISLENAILYNNLTAAKEQLEEYSHSLEEKVFQRTQELNEKNKSLKQALQKLQNTQTQLIQTEKMSSLGQMVAGIAHEINNPINFIHGNINYASQYIQDLLHLINVYQEEYPNPSSKIEEIVEEIDLRFLTQDLQKLLESMKVGSSRIRTIVLGLRNFSRLDESEMKLADIHEGIDNTLMILKHRLKAKSDYPEIEVIKKYGKLPEVNCYAGQLNQVFMNILSNAIDALEEIRNQNDCAGNPQICIQTEITNANNIRISITDNGSGIPEKVQQKIFDPFFTTKAVGSGTGLGLAISYQIVVDKHKGQLICNSTPGEGTEFVIEIPGKHQKIIATDTHI